jgi:hypothetical protein
LAAATTGLGESGVIVISGLAAIKRRNSRRAHKVRLITGDRGESAESKIGILTVH